MKRAAFIWRKFASNVWVCGVVTRYVRFGCQNMSSRNSLSLLQLRRIGGQSRMFDVLCKRNGSQSCTTRQLRSFAASRLRTLAKSRPSAIMGHCTFPSGGDESVCILKCQTTLAAEELLPSRPSTLRPPQISTKEKALGRGLIVDLPENWLILDCEVPPHAEIRSSSAGWHTLVKPDLKYQMES